MEFLKNLERLMYSQNMNRSDLARACGLSTSTVNSWWNRGCENISLQTLLKLSRCFTKNQVFFSYFLKNFLG